VPQVRVIDDNGSQLGIMQTRDAQKLAFEAQLDLVEVAPNATPPVCRIMDFGKYQYEKSKKEKEGRKKTHTIVVKEIRLRPKTDSHDLETKLKQARKFLEQKNKVKFTVIFRGRELAYKDMGRDLLQKVVEDLDELGSIEQSIQMEGRRMTMMMTSKG
jgi:translation initiation factor IF-3